MKRLLIIPFLFFVLQISATNYYVKTGGSDAAAGTSDALAWATTTKVSTEWANGTFNAGDSILFRRGDTFVGTITVSEAGTLGSPIVVGAYGTGDKPIITGFQTMSGWTVHSGDVYKATVTGAASQTNMVVVEGDVVAMGRYPDGWQNWLTYTTVTSSSITDPELPASPDWDGAEVIINKNYWTTDRCLITNHTGTLIQFTNLGGTAAPDVNRRYFIQNDIRTLTTATEWYHDFSGGTIYYYTNPSTLTVQVAVTANLFVNAGYDYIDLVNLEFQGSIDHAVSFTSSADYCNVYDCDIRYAGRVGLYLYGPDHVEVDGCNITNCNEAGIYNVGDYRNITNNNIVNIGLMDGSAYLAHPTGIFLNNGYNTVEYNRIQNISWSGINTSSISHYTMRYNFINYAMMRIDDGGGIYSTSSTGTRIIDHNIILNSGVGGASWAVIPRGIYYDAGGSGATISNNVVAGCLGGGYLIHYGDNHVITGNLGFDNQRQFELLKYGTGVSTGLSVTYNRWIAKTASQRSLSSLGYSTGEIQAWGTLDYNWYARPIDDDDHFYYASATHTLSDWKTLVSPDDANSTDSPVSVSTVDDIHFIYNDSKVTKYWDLSASMVDISNASFSGQVSLQPFTGTVLFGAGSVIESSGGGSTEGELLVDGNGVFLVDATGNFMK